MVGDVLAETARRVGEAGVETIDEVRAAGAPLAGFSDALAERGARAQALPLRPALRLARARAGARARPSASSPTSPPPIAPIRRCCPSRGSAAASEIEQLRTIGDFIAGMTDRFAIARHEELVGPVNLPRPLLAKGFAGHAVRRDAHRRFSPGEAWPERERIRMNPAAIALNRFGLGARRATRLRPIPRRWLLGQFDRFEPRPQAIAAVPPRARDRRPARRLYRRAAACAGRAKRQHAARGDADGCSSRATAIARCRASAILRRGNPRRLSGDGRRAPVVGADHHSPVRRAAGPFLGQPFRGLGRQAAGGRAWPACSSSRRSARMCSASSPTCCSRSSSIRRCCIYLDQAQSIGPDSRAGQFIAARGGQKRGLNENLAREILELHTLGVRTGYTQADVTEFARALTGWTVGGLGRGPAARLLGERRRPASSHFAELIHEPGDRARSWAAATARTARRRPARSCCDLAANPATAQAPRDQARAPFRRRRSAAGDGRAAEPGLSRRAAATCRRVYRALIDSPEAWAAAAAQVQDAVGMVGLGAARARPAATRRRRRPRALMNQLGQPTWQPGSPAG